MLPFFRVISVLEGLSYLLILSVTLGLISREFVSVLGMGHGVLFLLYLAASLQVSSRQGWALWRWLLLFAASLLPFGFLPVEWQLRKLAAELSADPVAAT